MKVDKRTEKEVARHIELYRDGLISIEVFILSIACLKGELE